MTVHAVVVSPGRTGTKWLSLALALDPAVSSKHETKGDDDMCYRLLRGKGRMRRDASGIARRIVRAGRGRAASIEVNGYLRCCIGELRRRVPGLRVFYLARDGRMVVDSIRNKSLDELSKRMIDRVSGGAGGFAGVCLYWARTSRALRAACDGTWALEDLLSDYGKFSEAAGRVGAVVPRPDWERFRLRRVNSCRGARAAWAPGEQRIFNSVCHAEMVALGYRKE